MKPGKVIFRKNPLYEKCPSCSAPNSMRRSRSRTTFETILKHTTFYKTYRCNKCGWRGNLSTLTITGSSLKSLMFYLALAILAGYLVYQLLRRFV